MEMPLATNSFLMSGSRCRAGGLSGDYRNGRQPRPVGANERPLRGRLETLTEEEKGLDGGNPITEAIATRQGGDVLPERGKRRMAPRAQRVRARPERSEGDAPRLTQAAIMNFKLRPRRSGSGDGIDADRWRSASSALASRAREEAGTRGAEVSRARQSVTLCRQRETSRWWMAASGGRL
jgi:hypothetical protein